MVHDTFYTESEPVSWILTCEQYVTKNLINVMSPLIKRSAVRIVWGEWGNF